ncbi:MAG: putative inorganic carbon transporter subunit DabA, partial [Pirellulaceae bacterium]
MSILRSQLEVNHLRTACDQLPTCYEPFQDYSQLEEALAEVVETIAPVWPLKDYVAVNPYAGISHRSFQDARAYLKVFSDCETLMPIEYYSAEYHHGRFAQEDIEVAIEELKSIGLSQTLTAEQIAQNLAAIGLNDLSPDQFEAAPNLDRPVRTIADTVNRWLGMEIDWSEAIVDEISKHCAAHYDQGQATWPSPYKDLSLYEAWQKVAQHDRNIEILGLTGFRKFVAGLPRSPEATIAFSLKQLGVPQPLWSTFLLCQAFSMPGWSAWTKYQTSWAGHSNSDRNDLVGLLAIRLA